ncbi:MAG: flagellar biosynthetic protein FliR [Rhodocyclaceae bacterium]
MDIRFSSVMLLSVLLLATRMAPVFLFAPPISSLPWPSGVRMFTILALAVAMLGLMPEAGTQWIEGPGPFHLLGLFLIEAVSGSLIAFGALSAFSAISLAGRLLDLQIGFGVANLFDPVTKRQGPLLGAALAMLAGAVFFAMDGHLLLFRLIADSLSTYPPGRAVFGTEVASWVLRQFAYMFFSGVALAFPVMLVLSLVDIGLALASKSIPQLGVFFLSLPIKAALGLVSLALLLILNPGALTRVIWQWFSVHE